MRAGGDVQVRLKGWCGSLPCAVPHLDRGTMTPQGMAASSPQKQTKKEEACEGAGAMAFLTIFHYAGSSDCGVLLRDVGSGCIWILGKGGSMRRGKRGKGGGEGSEHLS